MARRNKSSDRNRSKTGSKKQRDSRRGDGSQRSGNSINIYGIHTVRAALENPKRRIHGIKCTKNAFARIESAYIRRQSAHGRAQSMSEKGVIIPVETVESSTLDSLTGPDAVHQGVVAICDPLPSLDASELFHLADTKLLLVLDQITDPHNVGAILRSAVAMGVDAVLVTHRKSAAETAVLAKSASGALDMIDLVDIRNLSKAIVELNAMGFATIGLDSEGPDILEAELEKATGCPIALILGSEGRGLREQTREACTALARLDMPGVIKSLNVSNAAALSLYLASKAVTRIR